MILIYGIFILLRRIDKCEPGNRIKSVVFLKPKGHPLKAYED